mgnify:CR=1 FL=1
MVNVIIPTYKARETLPKTLDSLVAQTKDMFLVTIVQDGDGEDYSDIVAEYKRRGLKIFLLQKENGGPGTARQYGMDCTKMCDYVMFLDSDDMLTPRAVEILYREAKRNNADVISSTFIAEEKNNPGIQLNVFKTPVTWCFTAGTPILTETGYRPIEELKVGDMVYTKDGSLQPIENTMSHIADNIVSTQVSGALSLKTTENHKFFIYDEDNNLTLKPLNEIQKKDKVSLFKLPDNRKVHINPALAYIIGRYVGDGWKTSKKVKLKSGTKEYMSYFLCCAKEEEDYLTKKLQEANIIFGKHPRVGREDCPEFTLHKKNLELIKYIDDCGRNAVDKHFPTEFLKWDNESLRNLLNGYFESDGCMVKTEGREPINKITTISRRLAYETSLILRTLGFCPTYGHKKLEGTVQKIMGKECNRHDEYTIYWHEKTDINRWVKQESNICWTSNIKTEPQPSERVYNITVANNHSYIAGDFIVSNCHGKIYRLEYLRENNIRFPNELRLNEDSYFNLVAVNCAKRHGKIDECTYIWRDNPNSLTRNNKESNFFFRANSSYIIGQVWGLKKIYEINGKIKMELLGMTLYNIYKCMMIQLYYKYDDYSYLNELKSLRDFKPVQDFLADAKSWIFIDSILKGSQIIEGDKIIFFKQRFVDWVLQYIQAGSKEEHGIYR